ncbi:MAG: hypothetical protein HQL32_18140 [Planctomycetes bacterium]|nr:hypothetical protein [Planctomycetota bacterium]
MKSLYWNIFAYYAVFMVTAVDLLAARRPKKVKDKDVPEIDGSELVFVLILVSCAIFLYIYWKKSKEQQAFSSPS